MRRRSLELRSHAELQPAFRDDFQHLMLGMIAKLSPCSEQRLLDLVAGQAGSKSPRSRNKSIRQSVRDLQARGFVGIEDDQIVVTDAGRRRLQIESGTEAMRDSRGFCAPEDLKAIGLSDARSPPSAVAEQHQDAQPWKDVASGFEKAVAALRTVEPEPVEAPFESRWELMLPDAVADLAPEMPEAVPLELTRRAEIGHVPRFAWLIENVPRRMRAHVSVAAEIRVSSSIAPEGGADPIGNGKTVLHGIDVAQAMSLRLLSPGDGFMIEAQSPETQWVWRNNSQSVNELAAWRFMITPTRRGSSSLRLTFSYKEIGPSGLLADGALPDRLLDVVVSANLPKTLTRAAIWITTLIIGAALGAYLNPAMQFVGGFYQ